MKTTFADTAFYIALVNPRDELHPAAVEQARSLQGGVVTTEYVLVEFGNRLARSGDKEGFVEFIRRLQGDSKVIVVPADPLLFRRGFELLAGRLDRSLTDRISFVVMSWCKESLKSLSLDEGQDTCPQRPLNVSTALYRLDGVDYNSPRARADRHCPWGSRH